MIYEIVAVGAACISAAMIGFFIGIKGELADCKEALLLARVESRKQMGDFDAMMDKASKSNESLGSMCEDLERKLIVIDERVAMLAGTATQPGAGNIWPRKPPG